MNSDPNSDSKQCTESKLSQVHRVHTEGTQATCTLSLGRAHAARWAPYCGAFRPCRPLCHATCRHPQSRYRGVTLPGRRFVALDHALCRALCHRPPDSIPCHAHCAPCRVHCHACRSAPAPYHRALGVMSQAVS